MAEQPVDRAALEQLGLYDPAAPDAGERLELLEFLLGLGASVDDLLEWREELPLVASVVILRDSPQRWTLAEAAERAGMPVDRAVGIWRRRASRSGPRRACLHRRRRRGVPDVPRG